MARLEITAIWPSGVNEAQAGDESSPSSPLQFFLGGAPKIKCFYERRFTTICKQSSLRWRWRRQSERFVAFFCPVNSSVCSYFGQNRRVQVGKLSFVCLMSGMMQNWSNQRGMIRCRWRLPATINAISICETTWSLFLSGRWCKLAENVKHFGRWFVQLGERLNLLDVLSKSELFARLITSDVDGYLTIQVKAWLCFAAQSFTILSWLRRYDVYEGS